MHGKRSLLLGCSEAPIARHGDLRHAYEVEERQDPGFDQIGDLPRVTRLDFLVLLDDIDDFAGDLFYKQDKLI